LKDIMVDEFQFTVGELLVRNKSILDLITKFQDSNGRINRGIVKAVTQCGCVKINAEKQNYPIGADFDEVQKLMKTHIEGELCETAGTLLKRILAGICFIWLQYVILLILIFTTS